MLWLISNRESLAASAERTACLSGEHLVDDRAADADRLLGRRPPLLHRLEQQLPFGRPAEHDEAPIGLHENLEQAIQQLRAARSRRPEICAGSADLDQRPQLGLRIDAEPHPGITGRMSSFDMIVERPSRLDVVDQQAAAEHRSAFAGADGCPSWALRDRT